jgi:hypothetical protein
MIVGPIPSSRSARCERSRRIWRRRRRQDNACVSGEVAWRTIEQCQRDSTLTTSGGLEPVKKWNIINDGEEG